MKKATLLACAALLAGQSMMAQNNSNEVTYVEDASQGLLINSFKSNWFITGQGGVSYYFSHADVHRKWSDRFAPLPAFISANGSPLCSEAVWVANTSLAKVFQTSIPVLV